MPALFGWQFSGRGDGASAVVINLSDKAIQVASGEALPVGMTFEQWSARPTDYIASDTSISSRTGRTGAHLELTPYSVTLLKLPETP
jgi:hypothetical protein